MLITFRRSAAAAAAAAAANISCKTPRIQGK